VPAGRAQGSMPCALRRTHAAFLRHDHANVTFPHGFLESGKAQITFDRREFPVQFINISGSATSFAPPARPLPPLPRSLRAHHGDSESTRGRAASLARLAFPLLCPSTCAPPPRVRPRVAVGRGARRNAKAVGGRRAVPPPRDPGARGGLPRLRARRAAPRVAVRVHVPARGGGVRRGFAEAPPRRRVGGRGAHRAGAPRQTPAQGDPLVGRGARTGALVGRDRLWPRALPPQLHPLRLAPQGRRRGCRVRGPRVLRPGGSSDGPGVLA
jgi:hypothetical protein